LTFPDVETSPPSGPKATSRLRRQLADQAVAAATGADWSAAAELNRRLLELGPDAEAESRLGKALWELGELAEAREHYQAALALDPTSRIAERNIERLKTLLVKGGAKTVPAKAGSKAPVSLFVEETGKTGFAHLTDLADHVSLAQVNPGDLVELDPEGTVLVARSNGIRVGAVEPRIAARLLKLMAEGNRYQAAVTAISDGDARIIIREVSQDPRNYGKVSFPTAARSSDFRPYTKGSLLRDEEELEEELEADIEDEEIEDVESVLPADDVGDDDLDGDEGSGGSDEEDEES
jgi:tetratricopeptide (TPR) repeat protein